MYRTLPSSFTHLSIVLLLRVEFLLRRNRGVATPPVYVGRRRPSVPVVRRRPFRISFLPNRTSEIFFMATVRRFVCLFLFVCFFLEFLFPFFLRSDRPVDSFRFLFLFPFHHFFFCSLAKKLKKENEKERKQKKGK